MELNILIAEPHDILRAGLRTIFMADKRITHIYEVATQEDLHLHLCAYTLDLVIVSHSLITDFAHLPSGHFVVLTAELDFSTFQAAYEHGARGYLLENAPANLLRATLYLPEDAFLIEPTMTISIIKYIKNGLRFTVKEELLTPREKEILELLKNGIDRHTIAKQLYISEFTLKTHIKNITRKR